MPFILNYYVSFMCGISGTRPFQSNQIYATNDANDGLNLSLRLLLIDCLHGDVGNIIKTLYELSTVGLSCVSYSLDSKERQKNAILGCVSIVAMQTCVHLADLLTRCVQFKVECVWLYE